VSPPATTGERIRDAALDLFSERGFHGTGIRHLAEHAGVSSASLYHYMGTKEDLLVALMLESLERLVADADRVVAVPGPAPERLAALVRMHVTAHAERPRETRVVDHELDVLGEESRARVVALRDRYEQVWRGVLDDLGTAAGRSALTRRALLEMCSGVSRWFDPRGAQGVAEVADEYAAMALRLVEHQRL